MSHTAIAVADVPPLVPPRAHAGSPPLERISPRHPGSSRRILGGAKELLLLVGVAYAFPIAILVIGIPIALTINGLLIAAGWVWKALG